MVSVKDAYKNAADVLNKKGIEFYSADARILLEAVLNVDSGKLPLYYNDILTEKQEEKYRSFIEKRLSLMPVSYITNKKEFYGIDFYVDEGVLIPRFDTEILVYETAKVMKPHFKVADLCCGSGCIGLSIAKNFPDSQVFLFDISKEAIRVTKENIKRLNLKNAKVYQLDILNEDLPENYDLILSNPPYIPSSDIADLEDDVKKYEPVNALTDGGNGLSFYKRLKWLCDKSNCMGIFEIGINQLSDMKKIFSEISITEDINKIPRVIKYKRTDKMKLTEKVVNSKTIYEGRVINLKVNDAELENGTLAKREIVEHPGGVCVISIDENDDVLMVRQYRAPFESVLLEAPAGKLDKGEEPLNCGKREFLEETGYVAGKMTYMGHFYPSVGFLTEKIHIYVAENITKAQQQLDDDEFLNVEKINFNTLLKMVETNEIKDAKTVLAILMLEKYLLKKD